MEKTKKTPLRVLRSFRWQRAFERLIQEREGATTLKEMAGLINDIARIETDIFRPVTEEELKALEDDPMHGMSEVAMMYVYFMRATSTIERDERDLGDRNDAEWSEITKRIGERASAHFVEKMDTLKQYENGESLLTYVTIGLVDGNGVKKTVSISAAAIEDVDARELALMMRSSMMSMIWKKARKKFAYTKRRGMLKVLAKDKAKVLELRKGLLGKS